jgi:hypothetical protein
MKRIYVVKSGSIVGRVTGTMTPGNTSSRGIDVVPSEVRRFPKQLTAAANDMHMRVDVRNKGESPCA